MINNIRIVLVNTSHPGNIGAVARAMKAMELTNLYLVNPKVFPHVEATARAAGADDLLANANIVSSLAEALQNCELVFGTSARMRELPAMVVDPKAAAAKISTVKTSPINIAIVFGRENNGLTNDELQLCNYHIYIPTSANFSSLNIAAAVQIIAYEIKMALAQQINTTDNQRVDTLATADEILLFYQHLEQTLIKIKFLNPQKPRRLMQRLKRMFNRTHLEKKELNILRGILSAVESCEL